ncbi:MAG: ATP synthase F1 subunit delta [Longimicrobiales bacterium]
MRDTSIAKNYAEALFELGQRHGQQEAFADAMDQVSGLLAADPRVGRFLATPNIEPETKQRVLREALGERVPRLFLNFLMVLVDKRRQRLLLDIGRAYRTRLDEHLGRVHVEVTLAHEPDERTEEEVSSELSRLLGRTVMPHIRVDESILGGIIARYGDRVLDGSLRRRLQSLRRRMLETQLSGA